MKLCVLSCAAMLCCARPGRAAESAEAVLRRTFAPAREACRGELLVETRQEGRMRARRLRVSLAPPDRYSREVFDEQGRVLFRAWSDGKEERLYDAARKTVYTGDPSDADDKLLDPDEELDLLERSHALSLGAGETVAGRPAQVLEIRSRQDARLVRRLWVDAQGIVLRKESYAQDGSVSSSMRFLSRTPLSKQEQARAFQFSPPAGTRVRERRWKPDFMDLEEAAAASGRKPVLPSWLPAGFAFESVDLIPYKGASILHLRFTDGMDALSLFEYPRGARLRLGYSRMGRLRSLRVGRARARLAATAEGKILDWSGANRYVLIGSCSVEALRRMAESLDGALP